MYTPFILSFQLTTKPPPFIGCREGEEGVGWARGDGGVSALHHGRCRGPQASQHQTHQGQVRKSRRPLGSENTWYDHHPHTLKYECMAYEIWLCRTLQDLLEGLWREERRAHRSALSRRNDPYAQGRHPIHT